MQLHERWSIGLCSKLRPLGTLKGCLLNGAVRLKSHSAPQQARQPGLGTEDKVLLQTNTAVSFCHEDRDVIISDLNGTLLRLLRLLVS